MPKKKVNLFKNRIVVLTALSMIIIPFLLVQNSNTIFNEKSFTKISHVPITIDGNSSDWHGEVTQTSNNWIISKDELVWNDSIHDERTEIQNPDSNVDLSIIHISADNTYLYFLFHFVDITSESGTAAPCILIAIDTDQVNNSGTQYFGANLGLTIGNTSHYAERNIITRFGEGLDVLRVWDSNWLDVSTSNDITLINSITENVEMRVSWETLGIRVNSTLNILIATTHQNINGDTVAIGGTNSALDVATNISGNTWNEVSDDKLDYSIPIQFDATGQLITETGTSSATTTISTTTKTTTTSTSSPTSDNISSSQNIETDSTTNKSGNNTNSSTTSIPGFTFLLIIIGFIAVVIRRKK